MASTRIVEQIGRVLDDRYRLLAPIGMGASAHVFLADDVRLRRRVAVKILHPALADDQAFLRRFRAEAQAAAALNHPNIMAVFDWGEEADCPYLVCEYLGGGSLRAMLDRGNRLTPSQAVMVGLDAARGLDYAHRRGFVHRDIKPANLLFDDEGRLRIADFGLARALAEAAWTEPVGAVLGTARYAAPELVQGAAADGRADVYSLAVVLVEAVTGRVPFAADTTVGTLMGRLERPLPAPPELGPLGPVVARAGRPVPEERLDAVALGAALQTIAPELPRPEPLPLPGPAALDETVSADPDPTDLALPGGDRTASFPSPPLEGDPTLVEVAPTATGSAAVADAPEADVPATPRRRRRRWPWVVVVGMVLAVLAAAVSYAVVQAQIPSHSVPSQVNRTEAEARQALEALNFKVRVQRAFVDGTTPGQVTDQNPGDGTLKEGRTVTLTVSRGPTPVAVPDLTGLTQDAARARLEEARLAVGQVTPKHDEEIAAGVVLDWAPKGTEAPRGSAVALTVSAGPAPREVPDVSGDAYDSAAAALRERGLQSSRVEVFSDEPVGTVVSTSPRAGATVERGTKVTVNVSKGQPVVPTLTGLTVPAAEEKLEAVGLVLGGVYGPQGGKVFFQTPGAGTKVKEGTKVGLFIL
ncbi:MAG: PASTA domain-containing protein [Actinomycetota bacterium]|nr:PASTA domain-containing protein [Actinomycetota bacterium]